jgi:ribosomal protein S18 acetylase RimI-like enzyme
MTREKPDRSYGTQDLSAAGGFSPTAACSGRRSLPSRSGAAEAQTLGGSFTGGSNCRLPFSIGTRSREIRADPDCPAAHIASGLYIWRIRPDGGGRGAGDHPCDSVASRRIEAGRICQRDLRGADGASAHQMWQRLEAIVRDDDYDTLVACEDRAIVGFIGTRIGRLYEGDEPYGQIMALAVAADQQRRGVGRMLIQAAELSLVERGARVLVVTSGNHRVDAHAFYENCGYRFTGRRYKKSPLFSASQAAAAGERRGAQRAKSKRT